MPTKVTVETKVIDKGADKFLASLPDVKGSHVDIGIFGGRGKGSKLAVNKKGKGSGSTILEVALTHEFGTRKAGVKGNIVIPERSFLRSTVDENRKSYEQAIDKGLEQIQFGARTPKQILTALGVRVRRDVMQKIRDLRDPENKQSTKDRKGSSNPLIDTGNMRQSVEYNLGKT